MNKEEERKTTEKILEWLENVRKLISDNLENSNTIDIRSLISEITERLDLLFRQTRLLSNIFLLQKQAKTVQDKPGHKIEGAVFLSLLASTVEIKNNKGANSSPNRKRLTNIELKKFAGANFDLSGGYTLFNKAIETGRSIIGRVKEIDELASALKGIRKEKEREWSEILYECNYLEEEIGPAYSDPFTEKILVPKISSPELNNVDNLKNSLQKIIVSAIPSYAGGLSGIWIVSILGIGALKIKIKSNKFIYLLDKILGMLNMLGHVTAEIILQNIDPRSHDQGSGRLILHYITALIEKLKKDSYPAISEAIPPDIMAGKSQLTKLSISGWTPLAAYQALRTISDFEHISPPEIIQDLNSRSLIKVLALMRSSSEIRDRRLSVDDSKTLFNKLNEFEDAFYLRKDFFWFAEILPMLQPTEVCKILKRLKDMEKSKNEKELILEFRVISQTALIALRWFEDKETVDDARAILEHCYVKLIQENKILKQELKNLISCSNYLWHEQSKKIFLGKDKTDKDKPFEFEDDDLEDIRKDLLNELEEGERKSDGEIDPKILFVSSQKGGVGKTVIASYISTYFAKEKEIKTLLLELDFAGPTLAYHTDVPETVTITTTEMRRRMRDNLSFENKDMWSLYNDLLFVVPCDSFYQSQKEETGKLKYSHFHDILTGEVEKIINWARKKEFKLIVVDLPAEFRGETASAMDAVDPKIKSLLLLIAHPRLNNVLPLLEWVPTYPKSWGVKEIGLLINKLPNIAHSIWSTFQGISDMIMTSRGGKLGFTKATSSSFIEAMMPWKWIKTVNDVPQLRECTRLQDLENVLNNKDLSNLALRIGKSLDL